jgi:hypothetical protein
MHSYSYIFVLSMPRSGSTLFRMLLGNIKGTVSLPETFFFVFYNNHKNLDFSIEQQRLTIIKKWLEYYTIKRMIIDLSSLELDLISKAHSFKDLLDVTVNRYILENNLNNIKWVIEKSPPHIFFQNDIKSMFTNYRAIYLLRDPRAVAGSMLNKSWATHNIYSIARSWKKSTLLFNKIKDSIVVRYEDLALKETNTFNSIKDFFNSEITSDEFYSTKKEVDFKGVNTSYHTNLNAPISDKHTTKWKTQLSIIDKEQLIIEHVCQKLMQQYNYEISKSPKGFSFYLMLFTGYAKFIASKLNKHLS